MIGTFAIVLIFTMIKEAFDDIFRSKADNELNQRESRKLKIDIDRETHSDKQCRWEDIRVGDIVRVNKDEEVPADMLLISSPKDLVFVSTMNLDGETNLKDRELVTNIEMDRLFEFRGQVQCDAPDASLERWEGVLTSP
jgi:phospholipid-transporting ATPase